jgi:uncharacterized repeat protein (TIGR01451 family)
MVSIAGLGSRAAAAGGASPRWPVESLPATELQASASASPTALFDGAARTDDGRIQVLVELQEPSAAVVFAEAMQGSSPADKAAKQYAGSLTKAQVARIKAEQDKIAAALTGGSVQAREIYRVQNVLNGIAVAVAPDRLRALLSLPGVKRVLPIDLEFPNNSTSVPFLGTPNVWANTIGLPAGADGTGIRIGIIDTGIDYLHPDFGGPGATAADYTAEKTDTANFTTLGTAAGGPFPTAKVVGGTDFAGDAYNGANAPVPDPNPMDCNGHGSHVSGTAAGFGMTTGGATFTGPYDANTSTYSGLLIGPGTAPKALLYALRVFGCFGGTGLTVPAINWAMDPNGDSDLSDHLDVINMSLGSTFGSVVNATSVASDNAALAGVIVVTSAGNSGDTFFIVGSPGAGSRVIATAASVDSGVAYPIVQVNAPAGIAGNYIGGGATFGPSLDPSGTPPGPHNVVIALDAANPSGPTTTDGCTALTNAAAVSGNIALIDRGTCGFTVKVANAQAAGAVAVIIADNAPGSPPAGLGGTDPTITIPAVRVTLADGNTLKANIATLNATLLGPAGSDTVASFSSRGPRRIPGSPVRLKPDIAAPGLNITSVETGIVCTTATSGSNSCTGASDPSGIQVGTRTLTISGTSMASPHMAGIMALLRQLKPDWSVEELKALAMNYAIHDTTLLPSGFPPTTRFGPSRIGGGRVDPAKAAVGNVIAMNAEDAGLVTVTFDPEVVGPGPVIRTKKVRVVNKGLTAQTYDLAFDNVVDSPGVAFSLPGGSSVTVPPGETVELDVQMTATLPAMDHTRDPSLFATQGVQANYGDQPRNFLTEEGSYLTFSQSSTLKFRLPVYMAERPSSDMSAANTIVTGGAGSGSTTIALSGADLCSGTLAAGPTCTGTFPNDVESLVSPFELQVVSGVDPVNSTDYADIHYVGVSFLPGAGSPNLNNDLIMFGVASWGDWSTPSDVAYSICIDNNNDGVYDKIIYNSNPSIFVAGASFNDNFVRIVRDTVTNGNTILGLGSFVNLVGPNVIDSALHLNNVMVLGATPAQLGFASTAVTTLRYKVVTCPGSNPGCARTTTGDRCSPPAGTFFDQAAGPFVYNWGAQGLNFGGDFLDEDLNGNSLPVTWNTANMTANGSLGALLLHHHNGVGKRAEVVLLEGAPAADLALTKTVDNPTPAAGANVVFTITVTNNGPNNATGVVVNDFLPAGLTYVSDDGGGAYVPGTGLWTIGALANAAAATLHITATVTSTEGIVNVAEISSATPLDPNPANNRATVALRAPRSADLHMTFGANVATVNPGGSIIYTLTVKNNGQDPAYSVDVQEDFPAFPALNPSTFTASAGVYTPATGHWDLASLPKGNTVTLTFTVIAPNCACTLVDNASTSSARVHRPAKAADPNPADNTASVSVQVLSPATVTATKTVAGTFRPGGSVTYTVTLSNSSGFDQQDNSGHEFTDVLPASLTLVSATASSGTATTAGNTANWDGVVPASGSVTITINATINAATAPGTVSNQGSVSYDANGDGLNEASNLTDDPGVGGAADPTSFVVQSPATVTATKTIAGTFRVGNNVTYTVVLSNSAASAQLDNPGHEFTDVLPAGLTLVSATASSGTAATAGNTVNWDGTIPASGSVTITITATINAGTAGTTISNQATVNFDADGNGTNESSGLTDDPGVAGAADPTSFLVLSPATVTGTKTVSGSFNQGSNVVYTVVLTNTNLSPIIKAAQGDNPGHEFVDVLPAQLTLISATATSGTAVATVGTNTVTWDGSIPAGGSVTITITALIKPGSVGTISNQGTINFDADGNGTNESTGLTDDPTVTGAANPTTFVALDPIQVPTLNEVGLAALCLLLAGAALLRLRRRAA